MGTITINDLPPEQDRWDRGLGVFSVECPACDALSVVVARVGSMGRTCHVCGDHEPYHTWVADEKRAGDGAWIGKHRDDGGWQIRLW